MTGLRATVLLCLVLVAVVVGMFVYSVTRTPTLSDRELQERGVYVFDEPREIAGIDLTTHRGEPFTEDDFRGQWSFLFFGFTNCPDICPTTMAQMAQARRRLEEEHPEAAGDFRGMMVTVDPERDDAQTLARYVNAFSPTFVGVRGEKVKTAQLTTQVNAVFAKVPSDEGGYQVDHSANIVIVNPRGHYHGFARTPHDADTIASAFLTLRERWR